ncbi:acyl-CoA N-acyltransferase [Auriculariales sp. MPI-PUGE-AT-0066]|nr:acyl-CoA N-acyltransferase [Auriculariales sp. MPI-PUGE-AT-0066]
MITIRQARPADMLGMQACNLQNLPENYQIRMYSYHIITWPQLSYVAEEPNGRIVGYILAKIEGQDQDDAEEAETPPHGHVTSISVLRPYRRLGIAKKLMLQSQLVMTEVYDAKFCSLHVRRTNRAAIGLYRDTLGFKVHRVEAAYYADKEDALNMRLDLVTATTT